MTSYTLITGASSGIGFELAHEFARNKHNLILVARSKDKLEKLKADIELKYPVVAEVIIMDLSEPSSSDQLFEKISLQKFNVDILVNNAGFGDHGYFKDSNPKKMEDMIQLNILTLSKLCRLFLPSMLERGYGKILNVASTAAFQAGPLMNVYYATKAYVLSFSEGLYEELIGTGVSVTALCPGPTQSGFQEVANFTNTKIMNNMKVASSKDVAVFAYEKLMANEAIVVHGFINTVVATTVNFVPRSFTRKIVRRLQEKRTTK